MSDFKLNLRSTISNYNDNTLGYVLDWVDLDNNFINLKGGLIKSVTTDGSDLVLTKIDGSEIRVTVNTGIGKINTDGTQSEINTLTFKPDPITTSPLLEGQLRWSEEKQTLEIGMGNGVSHSIGKETYIKVINYTGFLIPKGTPVYSVEVYDGLLKIVPYTIGIISNEKFLGVTVENIESLGTSIPGQPTPANGVGYVINFGVVSGLNTNGYYPGELLYVSDIPLFPLTNAKPLSNPVLVGNVITKGVNDGSILVRLAGCDTSNGSSVISVNGKTGVVLLDKTDVGLGQVDNTSDLDKPISNATQIALDLVKEDKHYKHIQTTAEVSWLVEHNLNKLPSISTFQNDNTEIVGEIIYVDDNKIMMVFSSAVAGYAICN